LTDLTFDSSDDKPSIVKFAEDVGSMYRRGDHELSLSQKPIRPKACELYEEDAMLLELSLKNRENDSFKFLQKDLTLPAARGCAIDYRIQDVYLYKGSIVVFIGVFTRGFEGPDMRYMAVTGKLE